MMHKLTSKRKEFIIKIWEAEKRFDFFSYKHCHIPLWIYPTIKASNMINGVNDVGGQTEAFIKMNFFNIIGRIFYFFTKLGHFWGNDTIIFSNERYLDLDRKSGRYFNSMAEAAIRDSGAKKPLIFEFPSWTTKKYKKTKYESYIPMDFFLGVKEVFSFLAFFYRSRIEKEFFHKLTKSELWTASQVKELISFMSHCAYDITCYAAFLRLVKFLNPRAKLIYSCVAAYDKFPDVIEIQHGLIVGFHAQCFYPKIDSVKRYVENKKTIVFSEGAKRMFLANGYSEKNTILLPNPKVAAYFLSNVDEKFLENQKKSNKNRIVMISSLGDVPSILKKLIADIEKNKEQLKNWDFSLVLHPSEKNTYNDMGLKKVKAYENYQVSLWELLANSLCVVVVASSVIEEATYFGCFEIIIQDKAMADQGDYINSLAGNYNFKELILPENFMEWFGKNEQKMIFHRKEKLEIMRKNYDYFKKGL